MKILLSIIALLLHVSLSAQLGQLSIVKSDQNSIHFNWNDENGNNVVLEYGITKQLEMGEVRGLTLTNLKDATFYYVKAKVKNQESETQLFSTASKSIGGITVYFNQEVDNNASSVADAIRVVAFEDTLVSYINSAQNTLDICNYNTGSLPIVTAINNAQASGVVVRYIAADNTGTNNDELANLSGSIPMLSC